MILTLERGRELHFVSEAHKGEIQSGPFLGPTQNKVIFLICILLEGAVCELLSFSCFSFGCE